jgi:hypothetical protein
MLFTDFSLPTVYRTPYEVEWAKINGYDRFPYILQCNIEKKTGDLFLGGGGKGVRWKPR